MEPHSRADHTPHLFGGDARARIATLDGLRGLAACVVLLNHVVLASLPSLADAYRAHGRPYPGAWTVTWLFRYTPLRLVWSGKEFVCVFFVLSGFVLVRPLASGAAFDGLLYYRRRFIRLYLPVWGALALAAFVAWVVPRTSGAGTTWWLRAHGQPASTLDTVRDVILVFGASNWAYTSVLWSLSFEVVFSILLPLFARAARFVKRAPLAAWAVTFCVLSVGSANPLLHYLPVFMLGALLAFQTNSLGRVQALLYSHGAKSRTLRWLLLLVAVCCLTADSWLRAGVWLRPGITQTAALDLSNGLVACGAALVVLLALTHLGFARFLSTGPLRWTGSRSYSLYLVHEPIIVTFAFAFGGHDSFIALAVAAIPAALLTSEVFHRIVERPATTLSRRIRHRALPSSAAKLATWRRQPIDAAVVET